MFQVHYKYQLITYQYQKNTMYTSLSQKDIGRRISRMRKHKDFSQAELAKRLNMSRSSLAQIELGNRSINIFELQKLSRIMCFSLDDFMSDDFVVSDPSEYSIQYNMQTVGERVSAPKLKVNIFKNVLLYILEKCAGKPNVGETVLYKLLFFCDFNHYELYEEHLTGASYRKLPFGPVPQHLDALIKQMIETGQLQRIKTDYYGLQQTRYLPLVKADLTSLKASEKEVIDKVVEQMSDWSASAISNYSHQDIPWLASKEGEEIDYELVFYREAPFSVRNYDKEIEPQ